MTCPKDTFRDSTYLIGRRCVQLRYLFAGVDAKELTRTFGYCLAVSARKYGIVVHGWSVLLCEWNAVVTDKWACIPAFLADVHRLIAKVLNKKLDREGYFWNCDKPTRIRLDTGAERLDALIEVMTAVVEQGYVFHANDWRRPVTRAGDSGEKRTFKRPKYYFSDAGDMPKTCSLRIQPLPAFDEVDRTEYVEMLQEKVLEREGALHDEMEASGRKFWSDKRLQNIKPHQRHQSTWKSAQPGEKQRFMNRNKRREAKKRLPEFLKAYRSAYADWSSGEDHEAVFPCGTYALKRYHCVRCAAA